MKQMETLGLSVENLARIFRGTRVPTWLMPALEIYAQLPLAARPFAAGSAAPDGVNAGGGRPPAPSQAKPNTNRHPFARIEEL